MAFLKKNGVQIHYEVEGDEAARVLVFSHSLGVNVAMWLPQIPYFAKHFRVITYDTRGHGQTSAPPAPYSIEMFGRDVIALLDELKLERVDFCGLSMGGAIGMWLGIHAPERLHHLVLANTAARLGTADGWKSRIDSVKGGGMQSVALGIMERWFTSRFREKQKEVVAATQKTMEDADPGAYVACCEALRDMDLREHVEKIKTQTLVVVGAHDPVTTCVDGQYLVEKIKKAKYAELDAAHLSNIEDADGFNAEVKRFLSA